MKEVTREMIREYKIKELGYDFMGYKFNNQKELSFHHLIVARENCKMYGLGNGYYKWNCAILKQDSSHNYLHLIQRIDDETFWKITNEMIDQNTKGYLDIDNLKRIRDLLLYFEMIHSKDVNREGKKLIKKEFITNRIDL